MHLPFIRVWLVDRIPLTGQFWQYLLELHIVTNGVKPYEIVTHVDKKEVHNAKDFEKLIKGKAEINLTVLRMSRVRYVKVK